MSGSMFMVKIEETVQTTLVKFIQLTHNLMKNSVNISPNSTIIRKWIILCTTLLPTSLYGGYVYGSGDFETVEFLDRNIKNIRNWN